MSIKSKKALISRLYQLYACRESLRYIRRFKGTLAELVHAIIRDPKGLRWIFWLDEALDCGDLPRCTRVAAPGELRVRTYYGCEWVSWQNRARDVRILAPAEKRKAYRQLEKDLTGWLAALDIPRK